jgi:hypothetical protein
MYIYIYIYTGAIWLKHLQTSGRREQEIVQDIVERLLPCGQDPCRAIAGSLLSDCRILSSDCRILQDIVERLQDPCRAIVESIYLRWARRVKVSAAGQKSSSKRKSF